MKISEFHSMHDEFGKRPKELHTTKQRLMYGAEINTSAITKAPSKRNRMNIADMLKFAAAGVAAAAIITLSPVRTEPEHPPVIDEYNFGKYHYFVSYPTHRETLSPGGYALYLDIGTEEKRQAFYRYFADYIYEFLRFWEESGEEYINGRDDNGFNKDNFVHSVFRSETDGSIICSIGSHYGINSTGREDNINLGIYSHFTDHYFHEHNDKELIVRSEYALDGGSDYSFFTNLSVDLRYLINRESFSAMLETYDNKSYEEIFEIVAELIDGYFGNRSISRDSSREDFLSYETMYSMQQFTVEQGTYDLIMPEFLSVVRDDELYGYKEITVPAGKSYFLITGSDEYPLDKPYEYGMENAVFTDSVDDMHINIYSSGFDWWSLEREADRMYMQILGRGMYYDKSQKRGEYEISLTDFIRRPGFTELTGTAHVYYGFAVVNAETDKRFVVPRLCRLIPIEDTYYDYKLPGENTYTVTNNGDHEVVVMGNCISGSINGSDLGVLRRTDGFDQYFNYEPLLPGESITIKSAGGTAVLTMPQCCTIIDGGGRDYMFDWRDTDAINEIR